MRAAEIGQRLAQQAETVAAYLLPGGKRKGREWLAGNVSGEAGQSLKVTLDGHHAGCWRDYATDEHGDLLDLWAAARRLTIAEAMAEAQRWAGIEDPVRPRPVAPKRTAPAKPVKGISRLTPDGDVLRYLIEERKLLPDVLTRFRIAEMHDKRHGPVIVFPYLRDGERVLIKYLPLDRSDGKAPWTSKDSAKCLFGWQALPDTRSVVITEGEIDTMTLAGFGIPALSIPYGAGKQSQQEWIENDFDRLDQFDDIVVWMDADEAGDAAAREIVQRLGPERCRVAKTAKGLNDINDMARAGCKETHFREVIDQAQPILPDNLRSASDFTQEIIDEFYPPNGEKPGFDLGWHGTDWLRFRPAELIVVSGTNGHGKSQAVGQISLYAMANDMRCVIASMELPARRLLARLTRQATCKQQPPEGYIEAVSKWYGGRLWVYDKTGSADIDGMLEAFTYARRRFGCEVFVIDSLMMCGIPEDDYAAQKNFVERLMKWKLEHDATVFLVTHSRKAASESHQSDKFDVKGSGSITDLADTVLTVWRCKDEAREIDGLWICSKQRNGDKEGKIPVWFDEESTQFKPFSRAQPWRFVGYSQLGGAA